MVIPNFSGCFINIRMFFPEKKSHKLQNLYIVYFFSKNVNVSSIQLSPGKSVIIAT